MSGGRFHSFVILAGMRTGSNFLEANLNALPGVTCFGEVFNPHFIGHKDVDELMGVTLDQRIANPKPLLRRLRNDTSGIAGFRFFHDHDPRVLDIVLEDPGCAKIVLTRNPVDSYVSWKIAQATGQWKLTEARGAKSATARFDAEEFRAQLAATQAFHLQVLRVLQTTGQAAFVLDYEDLGVVEVLNGLAAFLGVEERLKAIDDSLKKQNPAPLETRLENPEDMHAALAQADLFGLARSPVFEPRRPPAVPSAVVASGAPLVFFPVRSGPDAVIRSWLAQFGPLAEGLDHKSLRQWKRQTAGHRSFTVVRHPLLRAHVAFRDRIVSGEMPDRRRSLIRGYGARLPEPGQPFDSPAEEREAFRLFLTFARHATSGQTGHRVDPHWASQTAILQGIAQFHPLDLTIREDRLTEALAFLSAEVGALPPAPLAADPAVAALRAIHDPSLDEAAEAAYARDYHGFGFGPWQT